MLTTSQFPEAIPTPATPLVPAEVVAVPDVAAVEENEPGVPYRISNTQLVLAATK